ncbi:DUF3097 domain-containing protein [Microlunatus parietis]|uniref:DUF3097 domain-containing protein n=1 Tax=Microlunatus parietis TaxID=682979 RepID=A0A7Y9LF66_9ACTN|nr:DUF3097 domain-containing protein [Microlunatus parietis]NYE74548.1 hypothetical protein [Microlunatus parietis]
MPSPHDRYGSDVLAPGWQQATKITSRPVPVQRGLVVEDAGTGFCGAIVRYENGIVVLEDRREKRRSFPLGAGFLIDGKPVELTPPVRASAKEPARTASGSVATPHEKAKVALPSRIYVEGRHDAELVEKVWGDDLRHVGVVVEFLGGIDDLPAIVDEFAPARGRRLGVLVDHLVPGSKETRIADAVTAGRHGDYVTVLGHPYIDIWQAVKPVRLGLSAWPKIPHGTDWKSGICAALGWPYESQADIAAAWRMILGRVSSWDDLERPLLTVVEQLIDFVTTDHAID